MGTPLSRFFRVSRRSMIAWTLIVVAFWPFLASPTQAQVTVVGDIPRETDNVLTNILTSLSRAAMVGLFNAFQTFLGQIAYDAADYIATGGSGQSSTFYKKDPGQYLRDVASDAAGEFIGSLSNEDFFRGAGFNLCRPDARVLLRVQLSLGNFFPGLQGRFNRPQPKCDFNDIVKNYDQLYQSLTNDDVLKNVQLSLNSNASDLGVTFNILNQFSKKISTNVNDSLLSRTEGGGFKSVSNLLSGNIKTPAQVVNETAREQLVRFPNASLLTTVGSTLSSGLSQGFVQLLAYTSSIFVNTLTSKLLKRIFEGGLDASVAQIQVDSPDSVPDRLAADTRNINISLKTPNLQRAEAFDVVAELSACPGDTRGTWNCTIDQALRSALVRNDQGGMTVQSALDSNLLHPDWQLIPLSDTRRNQDKNCYTNAYCAGNLQKLRVLRILSDGFELAANSPKNVEQCGPQGSGCVTLGEVVANFSHCGGASGEASPWCHLIDPNWILTSLPQQCVLDGYSDQLISNTLGQRRQECQDVQTCLKRNDQGQCVGGYGYCVAEKSVYRFGADECLPREASCRTYQTRAGQPVAYLRNTVDQAACTADNVGCLWYASTRNPLLGADGWIGTTSTGARIYLDSSVATCASSGEGCTKLREVVVGKSNLNLIMNPSFERTTDSTPSRLTDWTVTPSSVSDAPPISGTVAVGDASVQGQKAAEIEQGSTPTIYSQPVSLTAGRVYTMSMFIRAKVGGAGRGISFDATLNQFADQDRRVAIADSAGSRLYRSQGCSIIGSTSARRAGINAFSDIGSDADNDWRRLECSFLSASSTVSGTLSLRGNNILVDGVQLEEGEYATDFVDGINESLVERHLKIAPDEFVCTGSDSDNASCDKFAKVCRQTEAGCDGYTDVQGRGSEVPAILSTNDLCPSQCVGYSEYKKSPSAFDLVADADERFSDPGDASSTYFIPSTATSCSQADVGCEAFTNVEGLGGEQQAYFSYARSCRKPGPDAQTYFTWEGSDTAGYQLRTWSLVHDTATPPAPLIVAKREPGRSFLKEPATCNETTWRTSLDPDCRQFYDAEGAVSYRYYSQTVLSTTDCTDFRVSRTDRADCEKTDGTFDAGANECLYHVLPSQSRICSAAALGCREYRGSTSGSALPVLSETFRDTTSTAPFIGGRISTESLLVGDQSLRVDVPALNGATVSVPFITPRAEEIYNVTFWAKPALATTTLQLTVRDPLRSGRAPVAIGAVGLTTDWQRYTVGPFSGYPGAVTSSLAWTAPGLSSPYVVFLDEVVITRVQDIVYARRDTWSTPIACDQNAYGVPQPQAMLGCRGYTNRAQQTVNVRQFTQLCRETAIGCKGFVDTRNSDSVGQEIFTRGDTPSIGFGVATTTRAADRIIYVIDEPSKRCTADQDSCKAFGKPQFSPDRQEVTGFATVYLKDDITAYNRSLCRPSEIFCEEFTHNSNKEYFRAPENHTCEYREDVTDVVGAPAGSYSGWFEAGSNPAIPCYPDLLAAGQTYGISKRADPLYRGWVGTCSPSADECTELRDPIDQSDSAHPSGKAYYFIRNENLDTASCAGNVDPGNGCVLMRDTSDANVTYSARASYASQSALPRLKPVRPLDCQRDPTNPNCLAQTGRCIGSVRYCLAGDASCATTASTPVTIESSVAGWQGTALAGLGACHQDADCSDTTPVGISPSYRGYAFYQRTGSCAINDTNLIVKVKMDRDCAQWLGCSSSEVVTDPATNRARNLCTNIALCDQGAQDNGDPYCASYVDRTSTTTEPVLARGQAFTSSVYINRAIGLGQKDYSGYAIPNSFLATDLVNARVAIDGSDRVPLNSAFARDYRLAAAVPMAIYRGVTTSTICAPSGACFDPNGPPAQARILDRRTILGAASPDLHLCQHIQTGLIGYFIPQDVNTANTSLCYLAASFDPLTISNPEIRRSPFDFISLANGFGGNGTNVDGYVRQAFPSAECRAYPQPDAPFPDTYATRWDTTKSPPKPLERLAGYTRVNVCEYGEECSCSYKRADYPEAAVSKFYNTASQDIPAGVCVGGPRDGQGCLPSAVLSTGSSPSAAGASPTTRDRIVEASNVSQSCGDPQLGGRCVALNNIETVRGVFGQCLERDATRSVRLGGETTEPCLTWSPGPILFGEKDVFHYTPSAGYSPPPSSGQYYCTSSARKPRTLRLGAVDFEGGTGATSTPYAGSMHQLTYDDIWTSDEGKNGASIDAVSTDGSLVAQQCEQTDDDQDNDGSAADRSGLRLVNTGHTLESSYAETFFKLNSVAFVSRLFNTTGLTPDAIQSGLSDANIGYLKIAPIINKNGMGRLGCGYQSDWVDNLASFDYDDADQSRSADQQWQQKFLQSYNPIMTRGSEKLLKGTGAGVDTPVIADCVKLTGISSNPSQCYFKTWEVGQRLAGQTQAFSKMVYGTGAISSFETLRQRPEYSRCESDKPYFGIRAVFQTDADPHYQGKTAAEFARLKQSPSGPWKLVGFWVASCAAAANDVRYIYMTVDVTSADICKEIAEVRSKDSQQDAAFTDRVWKESGFIVPRVGIPYGTKYTPFASALTTRSIGNDDQALFQTGQDVAGFSPLNKPTFLASGADTYYRPDPYPKDKWSYLSNLFGRVYRIYRYEATPVSFTDNACLYGPFKGRACIPNTDAPPAGTYAVSSMCSLDGVCDTSALAREDLNEFKVCDSLSGINAGIACGSDPDICHTGAVKIDVATGAPNQLLSACGVNGTSGWVQVKICDARSTRRGSICSTDIECGAGSACINDPRQVYDYTGTRTVTETYTVAEANARHFADSSIPSPFVCGGDSIRNGGDCSTPSDHSRECPTRLAGVCVKNPFQTINTDGMQNNYATAGRCAFPALDSSGRPIIDTSRRTAAGTATGAGARVTYPDGRVYEVTSSDQYEDCYADYDCSFTDMNYYLKRGNGFSNIYSPRSLKNMTPQASEYGITAPTECDPGAPGLDTICLNSTRIDVKGCGGQPSPRGNSGSGHLGTQVPYGTTGSGCVLQAWRFGYQSSGGSTAPTFADQSNQCGIGEDGIGSGAFEDKLAGPAEWNRYPGFVASDTYQRYQVLGLNLNALSDAQNGVRSLRDATDDGGVLSAILSVVPVSDALDAIVDGVSTVVEAFTSCNPAESWQQVTFGSCAPLSLMSGRAKDYGRCSGGIFDGKICRKGVTVGSKYSCALDPAAFLKPDRTAVQVPMFTPRNTRTGEQAPVSPIPTATTVSQYNALVSACGPVSLYDPASDSRSTDSRYIPAMECDADGRRLPNATNDVEKDNNLCTHGTGYRPRLDLCPDPSDEFCGLIAYKRGDASSLSPRLSPFSLPTDVTMGLYTPDYLLNGRQGGDGSADFSASNFGYISLYKPQPPVVAALNPGQCREAGQCAVTRVNAFTFNGQTEGPIAIAGGQQKSTIQFYGWAAHNQMPIRKLVIDWGDGFQQALPDAKIKNHKPMCGGTKECYIPAGPNRGPTGLTCETDTDCPGGYGRCESVGTCTAHPDRVCSQDTDCYSGDQPRDSCNIRPFFGNSQEACESDYFEFSHVYTCEGASSVGGTSRVCDAPGASGYRCSGNPEIACPSATNTSLCAAGDRCVSDLATKNGCWDTVSSSCHYTPRVLIEDNWGWCTGECRTVNSSSGPVDSSTSNVLHPYGGCYSGVPLGGDGDTDRVRLNSTRTTKLVDESECSDSFPDATAGFGNLRPWIVYPGSLQLRSR